MIQKEKSNNLKAVDFFCGGGGMSYGMQLAGIKVLAGIDNDLSCKETYEANIGDGKFLYFDVCQLEEKILQKKLHLRKNDDELILIGCSPCQYWTGIYTDKTKSYGTKNLLSDFKRFVEYFLPGFVVVENVPKFFRRKKESGLEEFEEWLKENGYEVHSDVHDLSEYGVPQHRERFTLIANRVTKKKIEPIKREGNKKTVRDVLGENKGFKKLNPGEKDEKDYFHSVLNLSHINQKRVRKVKKNGGNRLCFANDEELQLNCYKGKDNIFLDNYSRMWWDRPAPTITTKFNSISNGRFIHPAEDRGISIREGAVLQSFPKSYKFIGQNLGNAAKLIGNAVPPEYARRIGLAISKTILCASQAVRNQTTGLS